MKFCVLEEKDKKNYEYFMSYLKSIRNKSELQAIDNRLQLKEIQEHVCRCNADDPNCASIKWIEENGKKFRNYLNTLKIVGILYHLTGGKEDIYSITFEEFKILEGKLNQFKDCLDTIF